MSDLKDEEGKRERGGLQALFRGTWRYARRYRAVLLVLAVGLSFETLFDVAVRYALKYVVDVAVVGRDLGALLTVVGALAAGAVLFNFVVIRCDYLWARTGGRIVNDVRADLFERLQRLPMAFHKERSTGDLVARFNADLALVDTGMVLGFPMAAMGVLELAATLVLMAGIHPLLFGVAAMGALVSLVLPLLLQRRAVDASFAQRESEGRMTADLDEKLRGQATIQAFGLERRAQAGFRARLDELQQRRLRAEFLSYLVSRVPGLGFLLLLLLALAIGGWLAIEERITLGELVAYQALLIGVSSAVHNLTWTLPSFVEAAAGWRRVREIFDESPTVVDRAGARPLPAPSGAIELRGAAFRHPGSERPALDGVSLSIRAGEYVAIVGSSGAGKSTLLDLLLRLQDVTDGALLVDDVDVRDLQLASLRASIGLVAQEVTLFDTSVLENIGLGRAGSSEADIAAAARAAGIDARIRELPDGYEARLGPDGARLSGGERQRIALARALVRRPAILALDEFSSALDAATESEILRTIEGLRGSCTIVSVTHRRTVADAADRVLVLDQGRLVDSGSPAVLSGRPGPYRRLWEQDVTARADRP